MRGPDRADQADEKVAAAIIRGKVFKNHCGGWSAFAVSWDEIFIVADGGVDHYRSHLLDAAQELGLRIVFCAKAQMGAVTDYVAACEDLHVAFLWGYGATPASILQEQIRRILATAQKAGLWRTNEEEKD